MKGLHGMLWVITILTLGLLLVAPPREARPAAPVFSTPLPDRKPAPLALLKLWDKLPAAGTTLARGLILYTIFAAGAILVSGWLQRRRNQMLPQGAVTVRFQPGREGAEKPETFAEFLEGLWPALLVDHPFLGRGHHLALTMLATEKGFEFFLWLPKLARRDFLAEIQAAVTARYPGARVEVCPDPLAALLRTGARDTLIRERWQTVSDVAFPLRGFDTFKGDPLNGRLRAARVPAAGGVRALGVQLLIRAIPTALEEGHMATLARQLGRRTTGGGKGRQRVGMTPVRKNRSIAVERKRGKDRDLQLFEVALETFALGPEAHATGELLWNLDRTINADASYRQRGVYQGLRRRWRRALPLASSPGPRFAEQFLRRELPVRLPAPLPGVAASRRSSLLTAPELTTILHLPAPVQNTVARLEQQQAVLLPAPAVAYVREDEQPTRVAWGVGEEEYGTGGRVGPGLKDRTQGSYMAAPTGAGKSTVLQNVALQDIAAGRGVATLDLKGGLNEEIIRRLPRAAEGRVVIFDPARCRRQVGLNPFDHRLVEVMGVEGLSSQLMGFLKKLAGTNWEKAPRMRSLLGSGIPLILELEPESSLLHLYSFFLPESEYRADLIERCEDPILRTFWAGEFDEDEFQTSITAAQTRLREFLRNAMVRAILCQPRSTVDVLQLMREKAIFLGRLTTDEHGVGKEVQGLLGALLLDEFLGAALSRTGQEEAANYYGLILDEFQSVVETGADDIMELFSKARSGGLMLVAAHQSPQQLGAQVLNVILDNVPNLVLFQQTGPSAKFFASTLQVFTAEDALNMPTYRAYARFKVGGQSTGVFSMTTVPLPAVTGESHAAPETGFSWPEADALDHLVNELPGLPGKERVQRLTALSSAQFHAYQVRRRRRDLAERAFFQDHPGVDVTPLYPWANGDRKLARVYYLSELAYGTPVEEVEAQVRRFLTEHGLMNAGRAHEQSTTEKVIPFPGQTGPGRLQQRKEALS